MSQNLHIVQVQNEFVITVEVTESNANRLASVGSQVVGFLLPSSLCSGTTIVIDGLFKKEGEV